MTRDDLEARLAQSILDERLLARDEAVVVGVSGGVDSVALLYLLCALNGRDGWSLRPHIAHLNHQLRGPESAADAEFVSQLAKSLRLPITVESADVSARAEATGVSIEQAGREARLEFFERVCLSTGISTVVLAHHADDNAETVLQRIMRGTGFRGLVGIRPVRPLREGSAIRIVRPMLPLRRSEIEKYLADRGIAWRQDSSNTSDLYTRNRLRHELLPLIREKYNPQVDEALVRLAEQARHLDAYLTETAERMLESLVIHHDNQTLALHAPGLTRKPRVIQTQLIRQAILRLGVGEAELTYRHVKSVVELAAGTEGSKAMHLPGLRVTRKYERLLFERYGQIGTPPPIAEELRVGLEGVTALPGYGLELSAEIAPVGETEISEYVRRRADRGTISYEEWMDADRIAPPLLARSRRPGDRFLPLGMTSVKKLSDFFIDQKIDADQRDRAVVLCDQLGPVWVVPFRIDERVRLSRATRRVLRLTARVIDERRPV